jgi:hypothetical protein
MAAGQAVAGQVVEPLTLRVSDAEGEAGGEVAVVIRTYASRGVGQGQICIRGRKRPAGVTAGRTAAGHESSLAAADGPFAALLSVTVFAAQSDGSWQSVFDPTGQSADVVFQSPTGSINALDGPLAVLRFALAPGLVAGDVFDLELVPEDSHATDAWGQPVALDLRAGELAILPAGSPLELGAEAEAAAYEPGERVVVGPSTAAVAAISSATFALRYTPANLSQAPTVRLDPRLGQAEILEVRNSPGLVEVDVASADASFGQVPGGLFEIELPTSACADTSAGLALALDPALTVLRGPGGAVLPVVFEGQLLPRPTPFTRDGFESADLTRWCVGSG